MSRSLRHLILLACLTSLPALASQGLDTATGCPGRVVEEKTAPTDHDVRPAPAPASDSKVRGGGGGSDSDTVQRSRPRWQSFLPGMIR
ncbi:hypothetical protein [Pseudomarimonas salicorniae]|uniref:Secreted protein n=1 Tax=Pseudomarimonas salicorniae TaxID=2933270 RepID=A0ABT0GCU4_9GAMM|nr:hypothetical protein [Lysobacter sp. CAU 1642]MCK7592243.1 hypothetical protein [Lysobacter sp. CAU 1642]